MASVEEAQPLGDVDQSKTLVARGPYKPTVKDMQNDSVAAFTDLWSGGAEPEFDYSLVDRVFQDELVKNDFSVTKLTLLEVGQYLEKVSKLSSHGMRAVDRHLFGYTLVDLLERTT